MTLGFIEWVLFLGMVGLIWMMLDIFGDDHYTVDKRKGSASPGHQRQDGPAGATGSESQGES